MTESFFRKTFGHHKLSPKEELEETLEKFKKPEQRKQPPPLIPPTLKKAGKAAFERFKEASVRMAEEERKNKPKGASKGIFEAFKEASVRAYEQHGTPGFEGTMHIPKSPHRPTMVSNTRYKKQHKPKKYKNLDLRGIWD